MRKGLNNLVGRGLALMLLVLFAVPCIGCDDAIDRLLSHSGHDAVESILCATPDCGDALCETPHHEAPHCQCLSDTNKVRSDKPLLTPIIAEAVLPPVLVAVPDPVVLHVAPVEPAQLAIPLLVHPAAADRAPPAA